MLTELLSGAVVYVVTGYTNMRKGIDGLAQIVEGTLKCDVYSKAVYLFCGRNSTKMKALVWDGDGFLLLYKRLDNGRYRWSRIYRIEQDMKDHGAMLSRTTYPLNPPA